MQPRCIGQLASGAFLCRELIVVPFFPAQGIASLACSVPFSSRTRALGFWECLCAWSTVPRVAFRTCDCIRPPLQDGSETVEEIINDLGIAPHDREAMRLGQGGSVPVGLPVWGSGSGWVPGLL